MSKINELLQRFSLSPQEAELYLLLLRQGQTSLSQLARLQQKNRTAVRFHLEHLLKQGLAKETRAGKRATYIAMPPNEFAALLERQITDFKSFIPWLESLQAVDAETPTIEVYEFMRGYYHVYEEISYGPIGSMFRVLEGKDAIQEETTRMSQEQLATFFLRVAERKIETKGLFTDTSMTVVPKKLNKKNRENISNRIWHIHIMPESVFPFQQLLFIYGDKIAFMFPSIPLVVTIKHKAIADAVAVIFDRLYDLGKPVPHGWGEYFSELK